MDRFTDGWTLDRIIEDCWCKVCSPEGRVKEGTAAF